ARVAGRSAARRSWGRRIQEGPSRFGTVVPRPNGWGAPPGRARTPEMPRPYNRRMPVRPIVRLGHPALRTSCEPVPPERIGSAEVEQVVTDLVDTLRASGGSGLAAPEIG